MTHNSHTLPPDAKRRLHAFKTKVKSAQQRAPRNKREKVIAAMREILDLREEGMDWLAVRDFLRTHHQVNVSLSYVTQLVGEYLQEHEDHDPLGEAMDMPVSGSPSEPTPLGDKSPPLMPAAPLQQEPAAQETAQPSATPLTSGPVPGNAPTNGLVGLRPRASRDL